MSERRAKETRRALLRWECVMQGEDSEYRHGLALTHIELNRCTYDYLPRMLSRGLRRIVKEGT